MLSENLKMLRKNRGATIEQIAEVAEVSRQAYSRWEKGETLPDIERCWLLARYYGITVDSLLENPPCFSNKQMLPAPKGKHIWGVVTVNDRGQIVIPREARELFSLTAGSRLVVLGDENEGIALICADEFEKKLAQTQRLVSDIS